MTARRTAAAVLAMLLAALGCGGDPRSVEGGGIVEMDEIDVSSLEGGRVVRLAVEEGDTVRAGDTVAVLQRGDLAAAVEAQLATARRAMAQSREVSTGPRSEEIRVARADLSGAEAALAIAEKDLMRASELEKSQAIAPADADHARAARDGARAQRDAARERLRILETGSRSEDVVAAKGAAVAAEADLAAARSRLGELVLTAVAPGVVLLRNYDRGEVAQPGAPIVTLGDPSRLWVRVYIAAPKIDRVRLGALKPGLPVLVRIAAANGAPAGAAPANTSPAPR
ncbi:MAG: HlyD family efflux transporter periplasmic adaptor subunit [Candidatus Eisenbacteria bacterium]|nr:HlyD family efflux transporter periplasmic adaptor subunit [Candidatus Eisenbacteria bacterium]